MPSNQDTPRSGGIQDEPTGPYEMARLIRGLRHDLLLFRELLSTVTVPYVPEPEPEPPARRLTVGSAAKWVLVANGVLALAVELAGAFEPRIVGPLQELQRVFSGLP